MQGPQGASLTGFLFLALIAVAGGYFQRFRKKRIEQELRQSIARQMFQTELGPISGAALKSAR